jgi:hypothetical protein
MPIAKIANILDAHSVPYFIKNGRIYADTMVAFSALFESVEDLTGWTRSQIYAWLGY